MRYAYLLLNNGLVKIGNIWETNQMLKKEQTMEPNDDSNNNDEIII